MPNGSCAECLDSMAKVKGESLARVACANCQQAQHDLSEPMSPLHERSSRRVLGIRCSLCGKWCWTKKSLFEHHQVHQIWNR